jgi:hypothetical protein
MYRSWMSKPKNGSLPSDEADASWEQLHSAPGSVVDKLGLTAKFRDRVGVRTKDLVIQRDLFSRGQVVQNRGKEIKNASQEDLDKQEAKLSKGMSWQASTARSRDELAQSFAAARAASASSGGEIGAFTRVGHVAQALSDVKDGGCRRLESESRLFPS